MVLKEATFNDQCNLLKSVLVQPEFSDHAKHLGIDNQNQMKIKCFNNMKKLLDTSTSNKRGNLKHDKREFHDVIFSSLVDTPSPETIATPSKLSKFKRSLKAPLLAEVLDMP